MTEALEDLLAANGKGRRRGCYVCGEDAAVQVQARLIELHANGKTGRSKSATRNFCAEHGVERFLATEAVIDG